MEAGLGLGSDDIGIVLNAIDKKLLPIDLYVAAKDSAVDDALAAAYGVALGIQPEAPTGRWSNCAPPGPTSTDRYVNRVRLGGIKFWLDGSLDTAWFTQPYAANPPGQDRRLRGIPPDSRRGARRRLRPVLAHRDADPHAHERRRRRRPGARRDRQGGEEARHA